MTARHQQSLHAQEMFEQVESFLASELSQTEFCQQHGLAYWTFRYWLKKYQARQPVPLQPVRLNIPLGLWFDCMDHSTRWWFLNSFTRRECEHDSHRVLAALFLVCPRH